MDFPHAAAGLRLHAARLMAGYYETSGLLREWRDVNDSNYRAAEKGRRRPGANIFHRAVRSFGVTDGFLTIGTPFNDADRRAASMVPLIERHSRTGFGSYQGDLPSRLQRARQKAGFRSASAAAHRMGWAVSRYIDHESRRRNVPFDQSVKYAVAFRVSPEELIFGTDRPASQRGSLGMAAPAAGAAPPRWPWLSAYRRSETVVEFPVIVQRGEGFALLPSPIVLPAEMLRSLSPRHAYFCVAEAAKDVVSVIAFELELDKPVLCGIGGKGEHGGYERAVQGDPLDYPGTSKAPIVLGSVSLEIRMRWS